MSDLIISVSGLRGIIGESLTPDVAVRYAAAFSKVVAAGPVIVARDGRTSGEMLQHAIIGTLIACGRDVLLADVAATPTVGVLVREQHAAGAIQISASHNPPQYNGIKLFSSTGRVVDAETGKRVEAEFLANRFDWSGVESLGASRRLDNPHQPHLEKVLETVDVDAIRKRGYSVLLDSNRGAGSALGSRLLESLGCTVHVLGGEPDGRFEHPPEPIAENLQDVCRQVVQHRCDIGFCQDPDADRLAIIDAEGNYLGEEFTVALCVMRALDEQRGPIVINLATSSMTEAIAAPREVVVRRSAVGEANVADMMIACKATYGGEGNGGPIDPRVGYVRDSFVGMAQVLDLMARRNQSIADLAQAIPARAMRKEKVTIDPAKLAAILDSLPGRFDDATVDTTDGVRLTWSDHWLLVRASNTEPIIRLIAEAPTDEAARQLCEAAREMVDEICGGKR